MAARAELVLDWPLTNQMKPGWRSAWWLLVAFSWLVPLRLSWFAALPRLPLPLLPGPGTTDWAPVGGQVVDAPPGHSGFPTDFPWLQALAVVLGAVTIAGLAQVQMGAGQDSCGNLKPARAIQARLVTEAGVDVTSALVAGPRRSSRLASRAGDEPRPAPASLGRSEAVRGRRS